MVHMVHKSSFLGKGKRNKKILNLACQNCLFHLCFWWPTYEP